jgi:Big-like domain-containing protein
MRYAMPKSLHYVAAVRATAVVFACAVIGACSLATDLTDPAGIFRFSGDGQTATVNTALQSPLIVLVVNQNGERLQNVNVTWGVASGGGTISATATPTDESGMASITYTTGNTPGTAIVQAAVKGISPISFTITVSAAPTP